MKLNVLIWMTLLVAAAGTSFAQPPDFPNEEALETLRFIRLAETKKQLDFLSEDQLLKLNDLLDEHEAKRVENRRSEVALARKVKAGAFNEAEAGVLLDQFAEIRQAKHDEEQKLFNDVRAMLNDSETLKFFQFYENFQKKIRRRIHMLRQGGEGQSKRRGQGRFRN